MTRCNLMSMRLRDAIHTHFVTLIGKWTIVGGWVKHRADKRGKVDMDGVPKYNKRLGPTRKRKSTVKKRRKNGNFEKI